MVNFIRCVCLVIAGEKSSCLEGDEVAKEVRSKLSYYFSIYLFPSADFNHQELRCHYSNRDWIDWNLAKDDKVP